MILPSRSFAVDIRSGSWMGAHRNSHWFTRQPAVAPAWRGLSPSIRVFQNRSALSADAGCEGTSTQLDCSEVAVVQLVVDDHPEVRWSLVEHAEHGSMPVDQPRAHRKRVSGSVSAAGPLRVGGICRHRIVCDVYSPGACSREF